MGRLATRGSLGPDVVLDKYRIGNLQSLHCNFGNNENARKAAPPDLERAVIGVERNQKVRIPSLVLGSCYVFKGLAPDRHPDQQLVTLHDGFLISFDSVLNGGK